MKTLKYFLLGFILMAGIHLFMNIGCKDTSTSPSSPDNSGKIESSAKLAESIFSSADTSKLYTILTESTYNTYKSDFAEFQKVMPLYANAFKNRKLLYSNEIFAEYEFSVDGKSYTVTFTRQDDGSWKITRL